MPLFQSEEGKSLLTKKINANKLYVQQQIENKENTDEESPQMPHLNTYEAQVMLSSKKPTAIKKQFSPAMKKPDSFLTESPELPALNTMNLATAIQQAKGTIL